MLGQYKYCRGGPVTQVYYSSCGPEPQVTQVTGLFLGTRMTVVVLKQVCVKMNINQFWNTGLKGLCYLRLLPSGDSFSSGLCIQLMRQSVCVLAYSDCKSLPCASLSEVSKREDGGVGYFRGGAFTVQETWSVVKLVTCESSVSSWGTSSERCLDTGWLLFMHVAIFRFAGIIIKPTNKSTPLYIVYSDNWKLNATWLWQQSVV